MGEQPRSMEGAANLPLAVRQEIKKTLDGVCRDFQGWCRTEIRKLDLGDGEDAGEEGAAAPQAQGKQKRKRKERDPNKPKRDPSPYNIWVKVVSDEWKAEHPEGGQPDGGAMKHASTSWPESYMNPKSGNFDSERASATMAQYVTKASPALQPTPAKKKKAEEEQQEEEEEAAEEEPQEERKKKKKKSKKEKKEKKEKKDEQ